jgi:hypothetical protein
MEALQALPALRATEAPQALPALQATEAPRVRPVTTAAAMMTRMLATVASRRAMAG